MVCACRCHLNADLEMKLTQILDTGRTVIPCNRGRTASVRARQAPHQDSELWLVCADGFL